MREEMAANELKPLPLAAGRDRYVELYLILARRDCAGPGVMRLAEIIQQTVPQACEREAHAPLTADRATIDSGKAALSARARSTHRPSARPRRARTR
jgi:hypothetical protein